MRLTLSATALASALALSALPASAQDYRERHYASFGYNHPYAERSARQLDRLRYTLRDGVQSGAINRWEARRLFPELRYLNDLHFRYIRSRGGMSDREAYDLRARIQAFRAEVRDATWDDRRGRREWGDDRYDD